jgi:hypothetical protein
MSDTHFNYPGRRELALTYYLCIYLTILSYPILKIIETPPSFFPLAPRTKILVIYDLTCFNHNSYDKSFSARRKSITICWEKYLEEIQRQPASARLRLILKGLRLI